MKKHKKLTVWSSLIALSGLCILALALGGFTPRNTTKGQRPNAKALRIQNKTDSFEVVQSDEAIAAIQSDLNTQGQGIRISLRNKSDKTITGFAVSVNGLGRLRDYIYNETDQTGILPHTTYSDNFGVLRRSGSKNPEEPFEITVLAVVYDDWSSEGDPRSISAFLNGRRKCKEEVTLVLASINRTLDSGQSIDENALDTLKSRISSISSEPSVWHGKEDALRLLDQNDSPSLRQRIENVRKKYEHLLARL